MNWTELTLGFADALEEEGRHNQADIMRQISAALAEREGWKFEIEEACVANWVEVTTPKETLQRLISWEVKMALDPAISEQPAKWVARIKDLEELLWEMQNNPKFGLSEYGQERVAEALKASE